MEVVVTRVKLIITLLVTVVAAFALSYGAMASVTHEYAEQPDGERPDIGQLLERVESDASVAVIAGFDLSGYDPVLAGAETRAAVDQTTAIHQAQDQLLNRLAGHNVSHVTQFDYIPYLALRVDGAALLALQADPAVTSIVEDITFAPAMSGSLPIIRGDGAHTLNYRGAGTAVAILDTGIDKNHADLSGKVVSEACYSVTDPANASFSACPNGQASQTGNGAATPPSRLIDGYSHGTHVAGIAAAVAPDTKIVAIQVFHRVYENAAKQCTTLGKRSPCLLTSQSSYIKGMERALALRTTYNIVAVNMSLGSGANPTTCDHLSQNLSVKLIVDILRANGVITVASSGNNGYRQSMGFPACLSSIVSVGATVTFPVSDIDKVADFSNISTSTTLLAPGAPIEAAVPGTTIDCGEGVIPTNGRCYKGGTSMAAPHVAGAIAILRGASPNATPTQIINALTANGPQVTDQRPFGVFTKRRLDVYGALCSLIACDFDDFRTLALGVSTSGAITSGDSGDIYYFNGTGGQRITVVMNRTGGTLLDPFLAVWDPDGNLMAFNDNGGGGVNARVNLLILPRTGRYRIMAMKAGANQTGPYSISVTQGSLSQNPEPMIRFLEPGSTTVNSVGFWAQIHGYNFVPSSVARLNGVNRPTSYHSSEIIWIWFYPSDLTSTGSRSISVFNPAPVGGTSAAVGFSVTAAFNGESKLLAPTELYTPVGQPTTFAVEWIHPTASWRNMQNMDVKLTDDGPDGPLWLRLTEDNPESTLYLLNSAGQPLYSGTLISGQFGADEEWVITDTVTVHFGETYFFGSGQTIVISPTVTFGPEAVGTYDVRFAVDDDEVESEVQNADVLGRFTVLPQGCNAPPAGVSITGPENVPANMPVNFAAVMTPLNTGAPPVYTWFPEPVSGQGTAVATYQWPNAGIQPVGVVVESCADFVSDIRTVPVYTTPSTPDLSLSKSAPAVALSGEPITVTLTITNSGVITAENIHISDVLPPGATHVSGGTLDGETVRWTLSSLDGFGMTEQVWFVMSATTTITNSDYFATADGGYNAVGGPSAITHIVDAMTKATPLNDAELAYDGGTGTSTNITFPAGSVFAETTIAYTELITPSYPLPSGVPFGGRAFRLDGYQSNTFLPDMEPGEPFHLELTYPDSGTPERDESPLTLYRRTGATWSSQGIECRPEPSQGRITCEVFAPFGEYALVAATGEQQRALYLPVVIR